MAEFLSRGMLRGTYEKIEHFPFFVSKISRLASLFFLSFFLLLMDNEASEAWNFFLPTSPFKLEGRDEGGNDETPNLDSIP